MTPSALGSALMIYVAVGQAGHRPAPGALLARTAGISVVLALLVGLDGMSFEVSVTVSLTDLLVLAG